VKQKENINKLEEICGNARIIISEAIGVGHWCNHYEMDCVDSRLKYNEGHDMMRYSPTGVPMSECEFYSPITKEVPLIYAREK